MIRLMPSRSQMKPPQSIDRAMPKNTAPSMLAVLLLGQVERVAHVLQNVAADHERERRSDQRNATTHEQPAAIVHGRESSGEARKRRPSGLAGVRYSSASAPRMAAGANIIRPRAAVNAPGCKMPYGLQSVELVARRAERREGKSRYAESPRPATSRRNVHRADDADGLSPVTIDHHHAVYVLPDHFVGNFRHRRGRLAGHDLGAHRILHVHFVERLAKAREALRLGMLEAVGLVVEPALRCR